jgi:hypothetical protein
MRRMVFVPLAAALVFGACSEIPTETQFTGAQALVEGVTISDYQPSWTTAYVCQVLQPEGETWLAGTLGKIETPDLSELPKLFQDAHFKFTLYLEDDDVELGWESLDGSLMKAVVVKGGSGTPLVYGYNGFGIPGTNLMMDSGLLAPGGKSVSHFHYCWMAGTSNGEGCTPGYWKNMRGEWPAPYLPTTTLVSVFGDDALTGSLMQALDFGGGSGIDGGKRILLRAATAALLNVASDLVDYAGPYANTSELIDAVKTALGGTRADMLALATTLDEYNNAGCPLNNAGLRTAP